MAFSRLIIVTLGILDMKKFKNHCCSRTFLLSRVVLLSNKTKKWYGTLTLFLTHSFFFWYLVFQLLLGSLTGC